MATIQDASNREFVQNDQPQAENQTLFSPRKVARSIGVSESSLKRWCDAGFLNAVKTAGGHRRISQPEVISFVKRKKLKLINPETIGLPTLDEIAIENAEDAVNQFYQALLVPDADKCSKLLFYVFLAGWGVDEIFDQVVSPAMTRIGDNWHSGQVEVYQERQACLACLAAVRQLNSMLPLPESSAPLAIGGAIEDDYYDVPTQAVEVTMRSLGWRATSLGNNLPLESLLKSALAYQPSLFWLSVSHLEDPQGTIAELNEFATAIPAGTILIVGGYAMDAAIRGQIKNAIFCDNLSQLVALVRRFQPNRIARSSAASTDSATVNDQEPPAGF